MTGEQAKQYEVCKTRKHEELPIMKGASLQAYGGQDYSEWKVCRWCGTQFMEVPEVRQVERRDA